MSTTDSFWKQFVHRSGPTKRQARSGSKLFNTLMVFLKEFFEKVDIEKHQQTTISMQKLPSVQIVYFQDKKVLHSVLLCPDILGEISFVLHCTCCSHEMPLKIVCACAAPHPSLHLYL